MIVVLDSGIWISALEFAGTPLRVVEHILSRHQFAICEPIKDEIRSGLVRKFGWSHKEVEEAFAFYLSRAIHVDISGIVRGICRDPKDDMVLECAVAADAPILVSGGKDLLVLNTYRNVRVLTARDTLNLFEAE